MLLIVIFLYLVIAVFVSVIVKSINNPIAIAFIPFIVSGSVLLFDPFGSDFLLNLTPLSFLCLVLYAFVMGVPYFAYGNKMRHFPREKMELRLSRISLRRIPDLALILLSLGTLGFILKLIRLTRDLNLPFSAKGIATLYTANFHFVEEEAARGASTLHYVGLLGLVYAAVLLSKKAVPTKFRRALLLVFVGVYLVTQLGIGVKVGFVVSLLVFLFALIASRKRLPWLLLCVSVVVVCGIVIGNNLIYSGELEGGVDYLSTYLAGPMIGLGEYLDSDPERHVFAAESLRFGYIILEKFGLYDMEEYSRFNVFFAITSRGSRTNVGTFLRDPYLDFGLFGMVVYLVAWSLVTFVLFLKVRKQRSLSAVVFYSMAVAALFLGFFGNVLSGTRYLTMVVLHIAVYPYVEGWDVKLLRQVGFRRKGTADARMT
jgi:oligosaccharide repeat unit polymerase